MLNLMPRLVRSSLFRVNRAAMECGGPIELPKSGPSALQGDRTLQNISTAAVTAPPNPCTMFRQIHQHLLVAIDDRPCFK
jgi:hypothetical protein